MRRGNILKGYCPICNGIRAFQAIEKRLDTITVYFSLTLVGHVQPLRTHYIGRCSRAHETEFYPSKSGLKPDRFPRRSVDRTKYKFGRGVLDYALYKAEQRGYRRPEQEAHYMTDHECDENCPEYNWPDEYWGDYE